MGFDERDADVGQDDALPSVEMTMMFLALCDRYGSHEAAVAAVSRGRRAGVSGFARPPTTGRSGPPPRCVRRSSIFKKRLQPDRIRSTAPATTRRPGGRTNSRRNGGTTASLCPAVLGANRSDCFGGASPPTAHGRRAAPGARLLTVPSFVRSPLRLVFFSSFPRR